MAKILENLSGRRMVRLNTEDIFMVVSGYQRLCNSKCMNYEEARKVLETEDFYLPEDL